MTSFLARRLRWPLSLLAAGVCLLASQTAGADWLRDFNGRGSVPFCPLVYGPACRVSMHLDLAIAYQQSRVEQAPWAEYTRIAGEIGVLGRLGNSHLHLGVGAEVGGQEGDTRTGFHVTPRLRLRYFPGRGPVTLELGSGPMFQRLWRKDVELPAVNRFGISNEASVGVLGFASVVGAAEVLGAADGRFGDELHLYVGGRLSILSVIYLFAHMR